MSEGYVGPMRVTAWLASPLAGDPPMLDGLLEWALSQMLRKPIDRCKVDRSQPCPAQGEIPIPVAGQWLGQWHVYHCSNPILPVPSAETVDHVCKRIAVEAADLLRPSERKIVSTTNSWTKSYRLPLRVRRVECVRWFCCGTKKEVRKLLQKNVHAIGKKPSDGYGRVRGWELEAVDDDWSWYAPSSVGAVLMRTLPAGEWLPDGLVGFRRDFGACCPPYWHPERYGEVVVPC